MRTTHHPRLVPVLVAVALATAAIALQSTRAVPAGAATPIDWDDPVPPAGTTRLGDAPGGTEVPVLFGFTRDAAGLAALAAQVSDPTSPRYGHHPSVAELADRFGVSRADRQEYVAGVEATGADPAVDATGAFADPTLTVGQLEALLGVTFGLYQVTEGSETIDVIAPDALPDPVPAALAGVDVVRGLDLALPTPPGPPSPPAPPAPLPTPIGTYPVDGGTPTRTGELHGCAEARDLTGTLFPGQPAGLAPNQILDAYGVSELHRAGTTGAGTRLALVEAGPFRQSDLDAFTACFGIDAPTPVVHGSQPESSAAVEATLDIEVLSAVVPDAERIDVFQQPLDEDWQFAPFLSGPLDVAQTGGTPPDVVSVSYGLCEPTFTDPSVIELTEFVLATGAAAGIGYHVASGDSGSSACFHNDGVTTTLSVGYPATSAWVTAVGGTNLTLTDGNRIAGQGAWNDTTFFEPPAVAVDLAGGTGGTSTLIDRPAWQQGPGVPAGAMRTVPDVALYADSLPGWIIYCTIPDVGFCPTTGWLTVGGTSASTPLFAGIAALATQASRAAGQPTLGFASPLLYQLAGDAEDRARVFYDVVLGDDDLFDVGCCSAGPDYDLATGWGSVDARSLAHALGAPSPAVSASPGSATGPTTVTFSAAGTTVPAGRVLEHRWDLDGDGTVDHRTAGPTLTMALEEAGTYDVALTVVTDLGRSASTELAYVVHPAGSLVVPRFTG